MGRTSISVELWCLECHTRFSADLSAEKFAELSRAWKLERECATCRRLTSWGFAEPEVGDEEQTDFWDWMATTGAYLEPGQASPQDERRKEPRIELQVPLRITRPGGEEEALMSENISRSGLCFSSRLDYAVGESLRIALQPEGGATVQTRSGTIVRCTPREDRRKLYGVRLEG